MQWLATTVEQLKQQNYSAVDWQNLIEEIEDMGKSERRSLENTLIVVLQHLLKWQYQPTQQNGSWQASLLEHRRRINRSLRESPSLKPYLEAILAESYSEAVKQASAKTGLPLTTFPQHCPYAITELLEDFRPQYQ